MNRRSLLPAVGRLLAVLILAVAPLAPAAAQGKFYELETLNEGLPPAPDAIDRLTPQGAVESLLDAIERDDPDAARHLLDLGAFEPAFQRDFGGLLARQLHAILERQAVLSWRTLLERPDALDAQQSSNAATAGAARRSILMGVIDLDGREAAIRLNRVKTPDGDPVWVFSRTTVSKVPALFEAYGPSRIEANLPDWLRAETPLGPRLWELLAVPLIALAAWFSGLLAWRITAWLRSRAGDGWTGVAFAALRWPVIIVVVTTVVSVLANGILTVSGTAAAILTPVVVIGYVTAFLLFALAVIDTALERMITFDTTKLADPDNSHIRNMATLMSAARRALVIVALFIGVGVVLASANAFRSLGFSLLASAGALTLVLGFAARQVLGNIMASLQIALNRSARIGDRVIYEGEWCTVERIHFTFVQLVKWNGNRLVVPVGHFVSDQFENWSMVDGGMICTAVLTFAQGADIDAMRVRFHEIVDHEDEIDPKEEAKAIVLSQDAFGIVVRFQFPCPDAETFWDTECAMRERLLAAAQELEDESGRPVLPQGSLDEMAA